MPARGRSSHRRARCATTRRFAHVRVQLEEYFAGRRRAFDVPRRARRARRSSSASGTSCSASSTAQTISYAELAARIGRPTAIRAAGAANGRNPISILIPCHRVIGSSGSLTGYSGGLEAKRFLLELERSPE